MNKLTVLCCIVVAVIAQEKYTDKYDQIDIDKILASKRLVKVYFDCVMNNGPCTPEGAELKAHAPEVIETGCAKCTEIQVKNLNKVIMHLIENEPGMWDIVTTRYDHSGKWRKEFEERAKKEGINIP